MKKVINRDAVTIKDLEREITDLRVGIAGMTTKLADVQQENHRLVHQCEIRRLELVDARRDVERQQDYQSRAHETIERLARVLEKVAL